MARREPEPDPAETRRRMVERLELIEAVVWALDHGPEVLAVAINAASPDAATEELMSRLS